MMRSNRPSAAAAARKSHAARAPCETMCRCSHGVCAVFETVRNDAVESAVCSRNGSRIARLAHSMRTPFFR
eukprot:10468933-Lingulodinium_polyedra.AAC.1